MDPDQKKIEHPQFTDEEIRILKQVAEGQKAMAWLKKRSTAIATWLATLIGAYLALTGQLKQWLSTWLQGG
jgi:hypothetical protein